MEKEYNLKYAQRVKAQVRTSPWEDFANIDRLKHRFNEETADINKSYSAIEICITSWKQINPLAQIFFGVIASVVGALLV